MLICTVLSCTLKFLRRNGLHAGLETPAQLRGRKHCDGAQLLPGSMGGVAVGRASIIVSAPPGFAVSSTSCGRIMQDKQLEGWNTEHADELMKHMYRDVQGDPMWGTGTDHGLVQEFCAVRTCTPAHITTALRAALLPATATGASTAGKTHRKYQKAAVAQSVLCGPTKPWAPPWSLWSQRVPDDRMERMHTIVVVLHL